MVGFYVMDPCKQWNLIVHWEMMFGNVDAKRNTANNYSILLSQKNKGLNFKLFFPKKNMNPKNEKG